MTLNEAFDKTSNKLIYLLERINKIMASDVRLESSEISFLKLLEEQTIACSSLIVILSDNKKSYERNFVIEELKNAHIFCNKSLEKLRELEIKYFK